MATDDRRHLLFLKALVLLGIIVFAFGLAYQQGFVELTLNNDKSYLSYVILLVYLLATAHWLWVTWGLSRESTMLGVIEETDLDAVNDHQSEIARYFRDAREVETSGGRYDGLLEAFSDRIHNRHAAGHFVADTLLKLGLLGTIIGFILMLLPVAEIKEFEANLMQQLLGQMSQGMAVALYTTLAGLVTSTLLKLQYQVLDTSAAKLVTRVAELSELQLSKIRAA